MFLQSVPIQLDPQTSPRCCLGPKRTNSLPTNSWRAVGASRLVCRSTGRFTPGRSPSWYLISLPLPCPPACQGQHGFESESIIAAVDAGNKNRGAFDFRNKVAAFKALIQQITEQSSQQTATVRQ